MAPKGVKKEDRGAEKAKMKARERVAEDKTFGLKNKNKSHKVQRYVQEVQAAAKAKPGQRGPQKNEFEKREDKKKEEQRKFLLQSIFSGVQLETKKDKKKAAKQKKKEEKYGKIDLYSDNRNNKESDEEKKQDTMDHWDQAKLEQVIKTKHNASNQNHPTEIICKYFLDAVEKGVYGWFWVCPNGGDKCKYRHALPPGYVLKKKKADDDDDYDNGPSIDEIIEQERQALPAGGTPVTLETFTAWKKKKQEEREAEEERKKQERIAQAKKEKRSVMSGRDLFTFDPTLFVDDDDASSDSSYEDESDESDDEEDDEVDVLDKCSTPRSEFYHSQTPQHVLQSSAAAALFSKDEELPDDD
ncbi:phoshoprotein 300, putative [Perkinsus marinus ATCC 50983]|uniref:Phoshoprotein 300, putative n=1 Tax=Perkinsus marinus (strain ATCC 50983 / TXsc) TaxID=423536 RepID=C5KLB2_PERM5|nr:phoshoprotein 300, putative [Perkinsus marinus ATCC 50983]EER14785.1 phoshoprotein 300, putative [Perkinsus marinus ATCC 50983]|eukprot:XP_002782989.1 phoshoprotein 300, putative [Perkinsus marinus ATCC 50983]